MLRLLVSLVVPHVTVSAVDIRKWILAREAPFDESLKRPAVAVVAVASDKSHVATAGDGGFALWKMNENEPEDSRRFEKLEDFDHPLIYALDFDSRSKFLAVALEEGNLKVHRVDSLKEAKTLPITQVGEKSEALIWVSFAPNGKYLVACQADGTMHLFDVSSQNWDEWHRAEQTVLGKVQAVQAEWSPDSKRIAFGKPGAPESSSEVAIYQVGDMTSPWQHLGSLKCREFRAMCWSPDNQMLGIVSSPHEVTVYNVTSFEEGDWKDVSLGRVSVGHHEVINSLDWSHDGQHLALGGVTEPYKMPHVWIWKPDYYWTREAVLKESKGWARANFTFVRWAADSTAILFATDGDDNRLRVWAGVEDCVWSNWEDWGPCSATCQVDEEIFQKRSRHEESKAKWGGKACQVDQNGESQKCDVSPCPVECQWGDWAAWEKDQQIRTREKKVKEMYGGECVNASYQAEFSPPAVCPECPNRIGLGIFIGLLIGILAGGGGAWYFLSKRTTSPGSGGGGEFELSSRPSRA